MGMSHTSKFTIEARTEDVERLMRAYGTNDATLLFQRLLVYEQQRLRFQTRPERRVLRLVSMGTS